MATEVKNATINDENKKLFVKLFSKDNVSFEIDKNHAMLSTLIQTSDLIDNTLLLAEVHSTTLQEIITYLNYHKGVVPPSIPKPLVSKNMKENCQHAFDAAFIDRIAENKEKLYELVNGANFMKIDSLIHLGCAKLAALIKGEPLDRIAEILKA